MRRRQVLELAALGFAGATGPLVALETLRHDLVQTVAGDAAASLSEWEAVAWDYGYTYTVTPPAALLDDLGVDLLVAREQLGRMTDASSQAAMRRIIAVLEAFLAQTLGNLGNVHAGRRWWRTARATADQSRDPEIRTWVRGREIIRGLSERWPLPVVLDRADEAAAVDAPPGMGTATVLIGRAQVLAAMGRAEEARAAMTAVYNVVEQLPDRVTNDVTSMYGWPEYRLRHGESFVYTHLGDDPRAAAAQERALALYPAHMFRERAQVQLHQAVRLVRNGNATAGAAYAQQVLADLPDGQRIEVVVEGAKSVVHAIPQTEQHRPAVAALREMLALPAAPNGR